MTATAMLLRTALTMSVAMEALLLVLSLSFPSLFPLSPLVGTLEILVNVMFTMLVLVMFVVFAGLFPSPPFPSFLPPPSPILTFPPFPPFTPFPAVTVSFEKLLLTETLDDIDMVLRLSTRMLVSEEFSKPDGTSLLTPVGLGARTLHQGSS